MQRLQNESTLHLRILGQAGFRDFENTISEWSPHVVHYMGSMAAEGELAFGDPNKGLQWVDARSFPAFWKLQASECCFLN